MDSKLLLVKVITLLFKESRYPDKAANSNAVVRELIENIKLPEAGVDFDRSRETLISLRTTALWLLENDNAATTDENSLLQRIRVNVSGDDWLFEAFRHGIEGKFEEAELKTQAIALRRELQNELNTAKISEIMSKANHRLRFQPETIPNPRDFVAETWAQLEPLMTSSGDREVEGHVAGVDFDNEDQVVATMTKGRDETSSEGIMRFGWQGLNRMTGEHMGGRRGEFIVVSALQHNFKTGFTLGMLIHIALFNKPWMRDPSKKPCLVHISLENEVEQNTLWTYAYLKENETGVAVDLKSLDLLSPEERQAFFKEAARYVAGRLKATGYTVKMVRWDPSKTTYMQLFDYLTRLEMEGYEVHACVIDYLNMMSKRGCDQGPMGSDIRDLFRRTRNFTAPRGILCITPHQMNPAAKMLVRQGSQESLVKEVANKGYYDGCSTIDQEVDLEIYIHKVVVNGDSFLCVQRGKHRKMKPTPEKDLFFVLPFSPIGSIRMDVDGADTTLKRAGSGNSQDSWMFD